MHSSKRKISIYVGLPMLLAVAASAQSADPMGDLPQAGAHSQGSQLSTDPVIRAADPAGDLAQVQFAPTGGTGQTYSVGNNAMDFTPGSGLCGTNQGQSVGWKFNVNTPTTVCAMSWFDDGQDGLQLAHEIGIWSPAGTLIANTHVTIPAGTAAPLDGIWRTVAIPPTLLPAGNGYIVGGFNGSHTECLSFNVTQTPNANLSYVSATFSLLNGIFEIPTNISAATNGFYGCGFQITSGSPGKVDAVDFVEFSGTCGFNQGQTIGWQFDVNQAVSVTRMSWYDDGQNGLEIAHEVGIWTPAGVLIPATHVTIPAGTGGALHGKWRTVDIAATVLPPGIGYIVGGYNGTHSECLQANVTQTVHPNLTYVDATFSGLNGILERPTSFSSATTGFYGVGFQIDNGGGGPSAYCAPGNANSVSAGGAVLASAGGYGTAGATFNLTAIPNQPGLLYSGPNAISAPFGCGLRCVGGFTIRGSVINPTGNQALGVPFDMSAATALRIQYWYRDPAFFGTCGRTYNLSNALQP